MRVRHLAGIAGVLLLVAGGGLLAYTTSRTSGLARAAPTQADILGAQLQKLSNGAELASMKVSISAALVSRLMEQDVAANKPYLDAMLKIKGADASRAAEEAIRAPYRSRITDLAATGDSAFIEVQTVTVGGRLTFSAVSFDGALRPKDPVSVVFFGRSTAADIYAKLTRPDCSQSPCGEAKFKDQDGDPSAEGLRPCHSQTQWVLMGSAGSDLEWRRSTFGVMGQEGGCNSGTRDHARLFGELTDSEFGTWLVATPHREEWTNRGHVIKSWQAPSEAFARTWGATREPAADGGMLIADVAKRGWTLCNARTGGIYQGVPFDGRAVIIATRGMAGPESGRN